MSDHKHEMAATEHDPVPECIECGITQPELDRKRIESLEAALERVREYSAQCAILRVEPTTQGLKEALKESADG